MKALVLISLGVGISLGAQQAPKDTRASVSEAQIERWSRTWQRRLDLVDWHVTTQMVRMWDLKPDTLGNLKWNSANKTAVIRVLSPLDYDLPANDVPQDIEFTIVHELVHLQLAALPRDLGSKEIEEKVVNDIAEALLQLDKGESYRAHSAGVRAASNTKGTAEASRSRAAIPRQ